MEKQPYYNFSSVRDQVKAAFNTINFTYEFQLPDDVEGIEINENWITDCKSRCTIGWCKIILYIKLPNKLPIPVDMYYFKNRLVAYVQIIPSKLANLKHYKILDQNLLMEEKEATKIIPTLLEGKG